MKNDIKMKNVLSEKGSATVLVFFTVFTFVTVLMAAFMSVSTLRKSQTKSDIQIQEIYREDYEKVDSFYNDLAEKITTKEIEEASKYPYKNPYMPQGFVHIGTEGWNDGYVIREVVTGNEFVWVPCVLNQSQIEEGDSVAIYQKVITDKYNTRSFGLAPTETSVTDLNPSNDIKASVNKYGGFYIARYEAGIIGETENYALDTKTKLDVKPLSKKGCALWNGIKRIDAITVSANMVNTADNVKSGLISGEAWDTTLQWMVNYSDRKNSEANTGYDTYSTNKGWYNNISGSQRIKTGYFSVNNIYDMGGNVMELTTENCLYNGKIYIVPRGGDCKGSGTNYPAACRSYNNDIEYEYYGFRVVLYKD